MATSSLITKFRQLIRVSENFNFRSVRCFSNTRPKEYSYRGTKVEVDGVNLHYEQVGSGSHKVLLLPGAIGSTRTDYGPQLEKLDHLKLTLVAMDPLGYGYSRPPDRDYPDNMYYRDADMGAALMRVLKHQTYSVLGWSDGGIAGLIMAARYPEAVKKLIVHGSNAYMTEKDAAAMEALKDLNKWSDKMKAPLIALYGDKYFKQLWEGYVEFYVNIFRHRKGDICKSELQKIGCPTRIIHGDQDPMVELEHSEYLLKNIKNSELHRMPKGKHNMHLRYADEFNKLVEDFLCK